jgi:GTP:adenosylcobinamide-phosphate guanylyltransferase
MKDKVAGYSNLYKDRESGLIENYETTDRSRYRLAKQQSLANINTQTELSELRREMDEIKSLLHQLIQR